MKKHKGSMISYLNPATQSAAVQRSVYRVENIDAEKIIPNEKNFYSIEGIEEMANSLAVSDHIAASDAVRLTVPIFRATFCRRLRQRDLSQRSRWRCSRSSSRITIGRRPCRIS